MQVFFEKSKQSAVGNNDTLLLAGVHYEWAKLHQSQNQLDSAFYHFNQSRAHYEMLRDSLQVAEKLILMADIYWKYNDYFGIEGVSNDALRFLGKIDTPYDTIYAGIIYNNYGLASIGQADYPTAKEMFDRAAAIVRDPTGQKLIVNNKAWAYMEEGNFAEAIAILEPLSRDSAAADEPHAKVLDNLGYSLFRSNSGDGLPLMQRSLEIREKLQDHFGLVPVLIHLSEYYKSSPSIARELAGRAYHHATLARSPNDRLEALQALREHSAGGELENYSQKWIALRDSLERSRQASRYQFARMRYDSGKAVEENLRLKANQAESRLAIQRRDFHNTLLAIGIVVILIIAALLYFVLKRRHREEKLAEASKTEERISKKLHDELANDVFNAMAFAQSQDLADRQSRETLLTTLDSVYLRTRDISRENARIDCGPDYKQSLKSMLFDFNTDNMNVLVQGIDQIAWDKIAESRKITLWRILQELMVNNKKHSGARLTAIRFGMHHGHVRVVYSDNGRGMDLALTAMKNGLANVENRIAGIGGTITFDSEPEKGLTATFSFPV